MIKNELIKSILENKSIGKSEVSKFVNKKIKQINNNIINYKYYSNLLNEDKNINNNISEDTNDFIFNFNNKHKKRTIKESPRIKIIKQIKQLYHYNFQDDKFSFYKKHQNFLDNYNKIIKSISPTSSTNNSNNNKLINLSQVSNLNKKFFSYEKKKKLINFRNNSFNTINKRIHFNSSNKINNINLKQIDSSNINKIKKMKIKFANYALNENNFKHPKIYILNNNKKKLNQKLSMPNSLSTKNIIKPKNLSNLIPYNTNNIKLKNNIYNYYIGMRSLPQQKFIL